jgi:hypothetical protein
VKARSSKPQYWKKKKEQIESDSHVPREVYSWNGELIKYEENLLIKLYY